MTSHGKHFWALCVLVLAVGCDAEQQAGKRGQGQINSGNVTPPTIPTGAQGTDGSGDNGGSATTSTVDPNVDSSATTLAPGVTTTTLPGETTVPPATTKPPFDPEAPDGKELYGQHCQVCHGLAANSEVKGADVTAINNAIKTVPAMKGLNSLAAAERALIGDFLKSLVESLRRQPRLAHRFHIAAKLRDIFTPALKTTALTNSFEAIVAQEITGSIAAFGGSCGRQDANCAKSAEAVEASEAPTANLLRRGLLVAACNRLTAQNAIVTNMMAHLTLTNPDAAQVKRLVEWMYPMLNDTRELETALLNAANALTGETNLDKWRLLMDRLCSAPLMELL
jgi:mono/diheme cytochrome c family protein